MTTVTYNPFAPDFYRDPSNPRKVYKRLRDEAPAHWSPEANMWALSRYDDVRGALQNWKAFSNEAGAGSTGSGGEWFRKYPNVLMFDPPRHTKMRRILANLITPDRMAGLAGPVRELVIELLSPFEGASSFDLTKDFADKLPSLVIADLLGIPREHAPTLMESVDKLSDFAQPDIEKATREALETLRDYYADYFALRASGEPGDDIVWHILEGVRQGILAENEAIGAAILVTIAGGETTTKMIGNMAVLLHNHPDQRELLVESPDLLRNAIEESLRYNSSTHMLTRTLTEDVALHGKCMKAGDIVALIFNSANNDDRKYSNPECFDIRRERPTDHLGFGGGVHACIGAPLARLELTIAFEEILKRWPQYKIDLDHAVRYQNPFAQGWRSLPFLTGA